MRKALPDARGVLKDAVEARVRSKSLRDTELDELRNAMSGLISELGHISLGDDSPNWYYFRLVPPPRPGHAGYT